LKFFIYYFFSFIFLIAIHLPAQPLSFDRKISPFPVYDETGNVYDHALFGGLNKPVFQFVDIDADDDPDLFLLDQDQPDQIIFFRNTGTASSPQFIWETSRYQNLEAGAWFKFRDIDGDNDFDLYAENLFSNIRVYRNTGNPGQAVFTALFDTLRDVNGQPVQTDGISLPEWSDIDCDTDEDLFLGRLNGRISLYENLGLDANNLPRFSFVTDTFQGINIQTGGGESSIPQSGRLHGANALTLIDIDDDSDNDIFWGDFFASSLIFLENYGSCATPFFDPDSIIELYPPSQPLISSGYNVPHFYDIDSDSDLDLFVGILGGSLSLTANTVNNFLYYQNTGNPGAAGFALETRDYLNSIDIGQNSISTLVDIDNDNDLDLFLANQEDLSSPNGRNSRLYFFENRGTTFFAEFHLTDTHYLGYDKTFDVNYAPVFVDIDADNDYDLFLGKFDGRLSYWQNNGTSNAPNFVLVSENYASIDIGSNSLPAFVDIDGDMDQDLFIGEFNGNINFYRNTGSASSPGFRLETTHYFGIDIGPSEFSYPHFTDIDRDGDFDLFIGSATQGTLFYRNIGNNQSANFIPDNSFQIPVHLRNTPGFIDLDGDGDSDLISGFYGGGLFYYENLEFVSIKNNPGTETELPGSIRLLGNYPNPFNAVTTIRWQLKVNSHVNLTVYNLKGQKVEILLSAFLHSGSHSVKWDASNVASGIYMYRIEADDYTETRKMLYVK
jgi:hypothetical protein